MSLAGKVAVVTGGSRGIGRAIAQALAAAGARVVINFSGDEKMAAETVDQIIQQGGQATSVKADVGDLTEVEQLFACTRNIYGPVEILVNNAGITRDALLLRMSSEQWDAVLRTNLNGVFNCTKTALKDMFKKKSGKIINITSVVGLSGNAGQANYAASKAGIIGFTKSIAKEVASRNIQANCIAPGFIITQMTETLSEKQKQELLQQIPAGRFGKPEDVANLAVFLASPASDYITGQTICVDGGMVM